MSAEEEREQRRGWRENGEPLDDKMISLLVTKVKCFHAPREWARVSGKDTTESGWWVWSHRVARRSQRSSNSWLYNP